MTLDLDAIKASQKRVYYGTDLADKEAHALAFLDSGVVDDLVAEVKRLRAEADDAATEAVEAIRLLGVAELEVEMLKRALAEARAAIARVRALHTDTLPPLSPYCPACNDVAPCPTIRAIDGGAS